MTTAALTPATQLAALFDPAALAAAVVDGHIRNDATGVVLARPFAKFFNHDQLEAPTLRFDALVTVTDKAAGSLGVIFRAGNDLAVATRGSFASDPARHATALLRGRYAGFTPPRRRSRRAAARRVPPLGGQRRRGAVRVGRAARRRDRGGVR